MKYFAMAAMTVVFLLIACGCTDTRPAPDIQGPITQAPPATKTVTAPTQVLIADQINATAKGDIHAEKAIDKGIHTEDTELGVGSLRWLMLAGVVVAAVGVGVWAEFGKLIGSGVLATGAALLVLSIVAAPLYAHRDAICWLVSVAGVIYLAYRDRARLKAMAESAAHEALAVERAVAVHLEALEHSMVSAGARAVTHAIPEVEALLSRTWRGLVSEAHSLVGKISFLNRATAKPSPAQPQVAPTPAPAAAPTPATIP